MIEIEHNVPLPNRRQSAYPWAQMNIGDSFVFPDTVKKSTAASLTYSAGKTHKRKFALRVVEEGIRCWRTG